MAIRGVYTKEEEKMLADFEKKADTLSGWAMPLPRRVASEESIKNMAHSADYWNPLWRDENYAINTRWGGIIAPPMYQDCVKPEAVALPQVPPSVGYLSYWYLGEDWEFFKPVRVNDSFKVRRRRPKIEDVTSLDEKGPRKFKLVDYEFDVINQRDELVNTFKLYLEITIVPEPTKKAEPKPEYIYTKEELKFIDHIADEEEIRGADIRYWEDVSVGEGLRPVVLGPTTAWDQICFFAGRSEGAILPMRELRKARPGMLGVDPVTGVIHSDIEWHFSDSIAQMRGEPRAFHFGAMARQLMARLVTNWMGDDGFLRRFNWRHIMRTAVGDTVIGRGKVTNKRVENGEHLVDLAVWSDNIRGNITEAAVVTVSLFSKEDI